MLRATLLAYSVAALPLAAQVPARPAPLAPPATSTPAPAAPAPAPFSVWTPPPSADWSWSQNALAFSDAQAWSNASLDLNLAENIDLSGLSDVPLAPLSNLAWFDGAESANVRAPWAPGDPADSLYRAAREQLNKGDYRKAADLFKTIADQYPKSVYAPDSQYWEAFALYRIGGTPELREALTVLAALRARQPDSGATAPRSRNALLPPPAMRDSARAQERALADAERAAARSEAAAARANDALSAARQSTVNVATVSALAATEARLSSLNTSFSIWPSRRIDAAGLAARIANVLAQRGLADDPAVKQALAAAGNECDPDDQSVRVEALSALMESDPGAGRDMATKLLAKRDKCSEPLRQNAVMLLGNSRDTAVTATLISVARTDPSPGVRSAAMQWLVRLHSDAALRAIIDLATSDTDRTIQRNAAMALGQSDDPKARDAIRHMLDDKSADASVQQAALLSFGRRDLSADDATWLEGLYARTTDRDVKRMILEELGRGGQSANSQWLLSVMRNANDSLDLRSDALRVAGRTMDVASLSQLYDQSSEGPIREQVVELLAQRSDSAAVGKLIDIAKNGTDPSMRRSAISALARSKDPRAQKLLLDLIDR